MTAPCPKCGADWPHECARVWDMWVSLWEAEAIVAGLPRGTGLAAHIRTYGEFEDEK